MFYWTLGALLSIGLAATVTEWSPTWDFLQVPMQILAFGVLLVLIIGAAAISMSKIWHKGQEIFDDWDGIKDSLAGLEAKVSALYDILSGDEDETLSESSSPVRLTKRGHKVAEKIHAEELVGKYLNQFDATDLDNAYDIQQQAKQWADLELPKIMESQELNQLKNVAFEMGVALPSIFRTVIGLRLRDAVLSQKGISLDLSDSDKTE